MTSLEERIAHDFPLVEQRLAPTDPSAARRDELDAAGDAAFKNIIYLGGLYVLSRFNFVISLIVAAYYLLDVSSSLADYRSAREERRLITSFDPYAEPAYLLDDELFAPMRSTTRNALRVHRSVPELGNRRGAVYLESVPVVTDETRTAWIHPAGSPPIKARMPKRQDQVQELSQEHDTIDVVDVLIASKGPLLGYELLRAYTDEPSLQQGA